MLGGATLAISAITAISSISSIVVHLDVADNVGDGRSRTLVNGLARAIEQRSGEKTAVDDHTGECGEGTVDDIKARTGAREVVCVQLIAAITTVGVFAFVSNHRELQAREDLDNAPDRWPAAMKLIAERLFPGGAVKAKAPPPKVAEKPAYAPSMQHETATRETIPVPETSMGPYVMFASSGLFLLLSGAIFIAADTALRDVEHKLGVRDGENQVIGVTYEDAVERYDTINIQRNVSAVLGGAALSTAIAGLVWYAIDRRPSAVVSDPRVVFVPRDDGVSFAWTAAW